MSIQSLLAEARVMLTNGRPGEAERICSGALASSPDDVGILMALGQSLVALGRFGEAGDVFLRGTLVAPKNGAMSFFAGVARQGEGRLDEAAAYVERATELSPELSQPYAKLGHIRLLQRKVLEAIPPLRKAVELDPGFIPAQVFLANALAETGDVREAGEKILDKISPLAPRNPDVSQSRGRIYQQLGRFDEAIRAFEETLSLDPKALAAHVALTYSRKTTFAQLPHLLAMEDLARRPELPAVDRSLLEYALGKANDDLGRYGEAMKHFDAANRIALQVRMSKGIQFDRVAYRKYLDRIRDSFSCPDECGSSPSKRPVLIVGMVRSGTTLVEQILSAHPDVAAGGEQRFWIERVTNFLLEPTEGSQSFLIHAAKDYERLLEGISPTSAKVTDKMPINYHVLGPLLMAFPQATVIHCRRNPVDTCLSIYTTPFSEAPEFAHDRDDIAFAYREYQREMVEWRAAFPHARILDLDYEVLAKGPEEAVRNMLEFIGLDWNDRCLDPASVARPVNTPSLWQVRQPIYRASVDRWRNYEPWLGPLAKPLSESVGQRAQRTKMDQNDQI